MIKNIFYPLNTRDKKINVLHPLWVSLKIFCANMSIAQQDQKCFLNTKFSFKFLIFTNKISYCAHEQVPTSVFLCALMNYAPKIHKMHFIIIIIILVGCCFDITHIIQFCSKYFKTAKTRLIKININAGNIQQHYTYHLTRTEHVLYDLIV